MPIKAQPITIFWFRRDLRLKDNHGFYEALKSGNPVLPVFIFDRNILDGLLDKKDRRVSFIHQKLHELQTELQKHGSSLLVLYDEPQHAFENISKKFNIKEVYTNNDYEPYAINRDLHVSEWLRSMNVGFNSFKDQVVFEKSEVVKTDGAPYTVFTPYSRVWKKKLEAEGLTVFPSEQFLSNLFKTEPLHFPSLKEIGFENAAYNLSQPGIDNDIIRNYHLTRNLPALVGTSKLSVHLRFGTISVRELVKSALDNNEKWLDELIWREFFMMILFHFPEVVTQSFKKKYDKIQWRNNEKEFESWCRGETGYPIVDAGMREMNATGWMHNRVRMIVAGFLTKHLLIDWRWGEAYFAEKLIDYELSSNNGNWQWAAGCGCDAAPYFRIFNPAEQARKFDPDMEYIKKWIPGFTPAYLQPIVEHAFARNRALEVYKRSLE